MSASPYVGEIRMFSGNFAPKGWVYCNGQELLISEYQALYQLIGKSYGGNGKDRFNLPDLRGRLPVHSNASFPLGKSFGAETVTLQASQLPVHSHEPRAHSTAADSASPAGRYWGRSTGVSNYLAGVHPNAEMHALSIAPTGSGQPHDNLMPALAVSFIIAAEGVYPMEGGTGMDEQFVGEIRAFAFGFAPGGWELCNGQKKPIPQDSHLYGVIGDTYGGEGNIFYLPNLQGRTPVQAGDGIKLGEQGGASVYHLSVGEMPAHSHQMYGSNTSPDSTSVARKSWATPSSLKLYAEESNVKMSSEATGSAGGGQPHENQQPSLAISYCIANHGIYPNKQ